LRNSKFLFYYLCFLEGRCLLELTHKQCGEGGDTWVPITKKVYWPPPGPLPAESSPSVHSGKKKTFVNKKGPGSML